MLRQTGFALMGAALASPYAFAQSESNESSDRMDEPVAATPQVEWSFQAGIDVSNGDFGADLDTTTLSVPLSARADIGDFRFSVTGSWLQIEGPGGVVADGVIIDGADTDIVETNSGIGDITLGVNYNVPTEVTGKWLLQLQGRAKIPVADSDRGLGTGEFDFGGAIDIAYDLGNFTPFTTVGYRFRGDPDGIDLNNTFNVSAGASYSFGNGYAVLGSYDFRQATTDAADASQEVFGAITGRFTRQVRWTLYSSAGFTDGAPDIGGGFQLTWRPGS